MRAPLGWSAGGALRRRRKNFWNSCCTFWQQYCEGYHAFQRYESPPSSAVSSRICVYLSFSMHLALSASLPFLSSLPPPPLTSRSPSPLPSPSTSLPLSLPPCRLTLSPSFSVSFYLAVSFFFSLSLSLAACRPPCCSCSGVNGPAKNPRGLRRTGESERATRPTWGEGSKTIGPSRPKSEARGPPAAKRRVKWKS